MKPLHCAEEYHILCSLALICDQSCFRSEDERKSVEISKIGVICFVLLFPRLSGFVWLKS